MPHDADLSRRRRARAAGSFLCPPKPGRALSVKGGARTPSPISSFRWVRHRCLSMRVHLVISRHSLNKNIPARKTTALSRRLTQPRTESNIGAAIVRAKQNAKYLLPDMDVISASLRSGQVPVVTYTDEQGLVTEEAVDGRYIAISHVWADGMGSTSEKGLPKVSCEVSLRSCDGCPPFH